MSENEKPAISREICELKSGRMQDALMRDKERLDKHSEMLDSISKCNVALTEMMKNHESRLTEQHNRIHLLERRPSAFWDKLLAALISGIVAVLIGFLT